MLDSPEVAVRDLRANLSDVLEQVARGATVIVTSRGKPVARLVPPDPPARMPFGALAGRICMAPDFDDTPDLVDAMEGGVV